jgi:hypothetical protein
MREKRGNKRKEEWIIKATSKLKKTMYCLIRKQCPKQF